MSSPTSQERVVLSHLAGEFRASRLVVSFYHSEEHAREALHEARKKGFFRSAALNRAEDGSLRFFHAGLAPGSRAALSLAVAAVSTAAAHSFGLALLATSLLAALGLLIAWFGTLWLGLGIQRRTLTEYGSFVLPGESLVAVQAAEEQVADVVAVLGHVWHPLIFTMRTGLVSASRVAPPELPAHDALALSDLLGYAEELSAHHEVVPPQKSSLLLRVLGDCERAIEDARADLTEASRLDRDLSRGADWLLDNSYVIRSHVAHIRQNLPDNYARLLPALRNATGPIRLRIYHLAAELIDRTGNRVTPDCVISFFEAYQRRSPLSIAELWVFPLMLRLVLLERLSALAGWVSLRQQQKELVDFWASRLRNAVPRDTDQFARIIAELDRKAPELTPHFYARLSEQIQREESALAPVQEWIETKTGRSVADIVRHEHAQEARDLMAISSAIGSLRQLSELSYPDIVEAVSRMEKVLREDPSGIHSRSDFATRDRARRVVEQIARWSKTTELEVAGQAIDLANQSAAGHREQCVAYYLLDEGRRDLEKRVRCRISLRDRELRFLYGRASATYLGGMACLTAAIVTGFVAVGYLETPMTPGEMLALGFLALFPASELAGFLLQTWITWILPPSVLPKLSFDGNIPDECRTLVVVPMMLLTPDSIKSEIEKLEVRYLANSDKNLHFGLLSDFTDAEEQEMPEDDSLVGISIKGIEQLNARHGDRFTLFHRPRTWCESEQRWIGWERKRGKLEKLNAFLSGEPDANFVHAGSAPPPVRYVITLDADTQLPHGSARRLIETIAHPLNRAELTADERNRKSGYTIIQPRVSITLPSATATRFTRLFTDSRGSDPYCSVVSDVYQDLTREAIYHGKAIYDVHAFDKILRNRFPEQRLLSHDLIEGAHVGVALASDIELFEHFPYDYISYSKRQHRWIRGDWQIGAWILPRVPAATPGGSEANALSLMNRWKVFDNLRRSLTPAGLILFLILSWSLHRASVTASVLVAMNLLVPFIFQLLQRLIQRLQGDAIAWREAGSDLNRAIVNAAFLPHQTYIAMDAISRSLYRLNVSKRHLLEWQIAELSSLTAAAQWDTFRGQFVFISALSAVFLGVLSFRGYFWQTPWTPFLLIWVGAPAVLYWIGSQRRYVRRLATIDPEDQAYLRRVARETWRYFDDLLGPEHNWLPPDNSQEALRIEVATRTSPTNIGMWLTSALSAHDFGYLTLDQLLERCTATLDTLDKLERCEGHLLNWYDTRTLQPLMPPYVSTVDSGNLIASLWVFEEALAQAASQPQLDRRALRGLDDTLAVIAERISLDHTTMVPLDALQILAKKSSTGAQIPSRLRLTVEPAGKLTESLKWTLADSQERVYWIGNLEQQVRSWVAHTDRYLRWLEVLSAPPDEFLRPLGESAIDARRALQAGVLPSWEEIAEGNCEAVTQILAAASKLPSPSPHLAAWLAELQTAFKDSQSASEDLLARARNLSARCEQLAAEMNMRFLYDEQRRLFAIGYQVGGPVTFTSHYDLLASEARLASLVSIAKGDVPVDHWLALGRPYTSFHGQVLLSWSGTMFEYLMPLLFMQSFRNSLLENACWNAVELQIEYARERGVPWGISECAYSALDVHNIYQYRAFGVPWLGLKRGLEEDLVIAPYATALALLVEPQESIKNLRRLEKLGLYGNKGFFESLDYTRQHERSGGKGVIVFAYMSHHQGMSLIAINNVIHGGIMRQRFHADRRIKTVEPLLFERIPSQASMLVHRPADEVAMREVSEGSGPAYRLLDEDTVVPQVQLLGNGQYALMITNSGGGYSRWGNFELTRWRADSTSDDWGTFFYIRDEESNATWSAMHQPMRVVDPRYTAIFSADRAEFRRRERGIDSHVEITVSPEDNAEIRRITFINHGARRRNLALTTAAELSLAPREADRAHPAFNKLFIETAIRPDLKAVLAWRRLRSDGEAPVWTAQFIVERHGGDVSFDYETSRGRFLGRARGWHNPAMTVEGHDGYVLDPAFIIRARFRIEPRQQRQFNLVTVAASSHEELMRLITKYRDPETCGRAFELAWSHAQLEFRHLGIKSESSFRYMELASHLLYPNYRLRAPAERLRRNRQGQSRLWAYGISGDLPIVAVMISEAQGLQLAREVLIAHTYWRLHGFKADLVILNREPSAYDQPLQQQLQNLVAAHSSNTGVDCPGGVFLRKAAQIPEEDLNLILTTAHATLGVVQGSLVQQLAALSTELPLPPPLVARNIAEYPSQPLPFLDLPYFNGLGGFTGDGREYAIYLGPNVTTPLPWVNVMANSKFGCVTSESGCGSCWFGNSQSNRLTPWNNDPISDPATDTFYIRDEESGVFWTPTPLPVRELDAYRARHGQGYTEFEHNSHGLAQTLLTFVPVDANGGAPLRIQHLRIKNTSRSRRRLSITWYAELVLGSHRETTQMHIVTSWDENAKLLSARNAYHPHYGGRVVFASMTPAATSYTGDRSSFLGRHKSEESPDAMRRRSLTKRVGPGLDPCAALQTSIELLPNQEEVIIVVLGEADDIEQARSLATRYRGKDAGQQALTETRQWWDALLSTIHVETPVLSIDLLLNRWLLYQSLSCRIWGRTAFYQSSGAYGYRDQLQDALAMVYSAPDIARAAILNASSRQFAEGDVQHWWHPESGAGIRSRCSDDLLWLPFAVCHYIEVTGDVSVLDATTPFLEGPLLQPEEHEAFFQPEVSGEQATIFEHCHRAIERGSTEGPHGLPLIGTCDWNDGMNTVGDKGVGESVWLAWFLVDVLTKFSTVCEGRGDADVALEYRARARRYAEAVESTSWDGEWYRRAYFDDGTPLGSRENQEARIDSLAQSWSVISGAARRDRAEQAMRSVEKHLVRERDRLVLLFTPPFDVSTPHPGYIMGYPPGVRENGGQYTHAALWVAMAFARMGNGERAVEILQLLNPIEHSRSPEECALYQTEPYVVAADVYALKGQVGRGGWTWYTGSAGWMYRVWLEEVLGFRLRSNRLSIEPKLPSEWPGYTITFRFRRTKYRIEVKNGGQEHIAEILLQDDQREHDICLVLGQRRTAASSELATVQETKSQN